jgi:hypothetical protein
MWVAHIRTMFVQRDRGSTETPPPTLGVHQFAYAREPLHHSYSPLFVGGLWCTLCH